jgi:hypothetical protein
MDKRRACVLTMNCIANGISFACCSESQKTSTRFCSREAEHVKLVWLLGSLPSLYERRAASTAHSAAPDTSCLCVRFSESVEFPLESAVITQRIKRRDISRFVAKGDASVAARIAGDAGCQGRAARSDREQIHGKSYYAQRHPGTHKGSPELPKL